MKSKVIKSERVVTLVTKKDKYWLNVTANKAGVSTGAYVRGLIEKAIAVHKKGEK